MSDRAPSPGEIAARTLRFAALGAARIASRWPGMVAAVLAYVAVAVPTALAGAGYPQLLGALAAGVVGAGWYASPLGRFEARRRA